MQASIPATASAPLTQQPDSGFGGLDGDVSSHFELSGIVEAFDADFSNRIHMKWVILTL